jgi:putative ABC transport system substrate-binding protein
MHVAAQKRGAARRRRMERREFISLVGGAVMTRVLVASPVAPFSLLAAEAQQRDKIARIGFLMPQDPFPPWIDAFRVGMQKEGYIEGQNVIIEARSASGKKELYQPLIADLMRLKVDVFMTWSTPTSLALREATSSVPIVSISGDPVGIGLAASLAHPGGNLTGFAILTEGLEAKQVQLLRDTVPHLSEIAVLWNPTNPAMKPDLAFVQSAASQLGVTVQSLPVQEANTFDDAFDAIARQGSGALLVLRDDLFEVESNRLRIATLARERRLPTMFGWREEVQGGGLLAYGVNFSDLFRRAAGYIDKILRGAAPRDLPIAQPERFEFFVNIKTANAIGLTIPLEILAQADEVIE